MIVVKFGENRKSNLSLQVPPTCRDKLAMRFPIVFISGDPEQDILHPFAWKNIRRLVTIHLESRQCPQGHGHHSATEQVVISHIRQRAVYPVAKPLLKLNMGRRRQDDFFQLASRLVAANPHHSIDCRHTSSIHRLIQSYFIIRRFHHNSYSCSFTNNSTLRRFNPYQPFQPPPPTLPETSSLPR